eukprot:TRINITY_DN2626_c0_g1_i1.p1 TRINITY_DN2626_c0_g1~~TRINITY_DN2626_c0_g1_i1.p1  ORF type:complete len:563 (+),score=122.71 TRINITY_DN2626_c0_g1_i1:966-2654(+)
MLNRGVCSLPLQSSDVPMSFSTAHQTREGNTYSNMDHVQEWARGSQQPRCYSNSLKVLGLALFGVGVLLVLVAFLETIGLALPPFSNEVLLWWDAAGFIVGPTMWFGVVWMFVGVWCWVASQFRLMLNLLTTVMLLVTCLCFTLALTSSMVGYGGIVDDVHRVWSIASNNTVCNLEQGLGCRGLSQPCPPSRTQDPDAEEHNVTTNVTRWISWRYFTARFVTDSQCRTCTTEAEYTNQTCLSLIQADALHVITPFAMTTGALFGSLSFICVMCTKPLGLAFALTTVLFMLMIYIFAEWRALWDPSQEEVQRAQRNVALAANVVALQLSLISIAGLHWKDYPSEVKKPITVILAIVPIFAWASFIALFIPATEVFFGVLREVYCTVLLWKLVTIWDETAETVPLIAAGKASKETASRDRSKLRSYVLYLVVLKIMLDINNYIFEDVYPSWLLTVLIWSSAFLFCVILAVIQEIFNRLPQIETTGKGQFLSVKAIISFIFFDFTILKLLHYEGLQSVIVGELYIAMALVCLAAFQLYTWLVIPLGEKLHQFPSSNRISFLIDQR